MLKQTPNIIALIANVLQETAGQPANQIRAALRQACPYGQTEYRLLNEWRAEVSRQRGLWPRQPITTFVEVFA